MAPCGLSAPVGDRRGDLWAAHAATTPAPRRSRWGDWCLSMVEGEAGYSCANYCEASLQVLAAITGWAARLSGVAVLPVKGTRCSGGTQDVAQRALPSSCTSTAPNLPLHSSRRHPKVAVGAPDAQHHQRVGAPPFPPGKQTAVPVLLRDAPPQAVAWSQSRRADQAASAGQMTPRQGEAPSVLK